MVKKRQSEYSVQELTYLRLFFHTFAEFKNCHLRLQFCQKLIPAKHDHICCSTQPIIDQLLWNLVRTEDNAYVFKDIRLCLCRWCNDHSNLAGSRRGNKKRTAIYHRAAGASLNLTKSRTLPLGILNTEIDPMGIIYVKKTKIFNMIFHVTNSEITRRAWSSIVRHTRHSLCSAFLRDLNLLQCVRYVNIFQLS